MKFKHGTRRRALEYEKDWAERWKREKTFEKSVKNRSIDNAYVFYDGPPFITGVPHHGTLLSSIIKDAVPRYQTMKGKRVERVWGWDCHGLPAENFVEKQLVITDRRQILTDKDQQAPLDKEGNPLKTYELEEYINIACQSMVENSETWESIIDRVGRWVDFKGAYRTMDKKYMESVWWAFKKLYDAGKIYEGEKVLMYDTKFATPVSKNEVTMDNDAYQAVTDPSVFVKFKLKRGDQVKSKINLSENSKILFVCCENIGRSQMARAVYNQLTGDNRADGAATGTGKEFRPGTVAELEEAKSEELGEVYESTAKIAILEKLGVDISDTPRVKLSPDMLEKYDLVVNMAEKWQTPDWLRGENVIWWNVKDPGMVEDYDGRMTASRDALGVIEKRVKELVGGEIVDDEIGASHLLAWTTTPWTLPGNTALAVNKDFDYVEVELDGEKLIVAKDLAPKVFVDDRKQPLEYKVLREMKGSELVGLSYEPLLEFEKFGDLAPKKHPLAVITDKDFDKNAPDFDEAKSWNREAARAVLENSNGKIALMYSEKWDYYKLPGGGIDDGETREKALKREILEEVGVQAEVLKEIGTLEELRSLDNMHQISYAYHAKTVGEIGQNALEEGELEERFVVVWTDLDKAIELMKIGDRDSGRGLNMRFIARRDELILREYKRQLAQPEMQSTDKNAHKVWAADYVSAENGTGIVHIAPAYGEDDFELAKENNIPVVHTLDDNGYYFPEIAEKLYQLMPWRDASRPLEVWESNKDIAKGLKKAGIVWKTEYIEHEYPFNPRSKQRIMYRAIPSWFFDIQNSKGIMLEENQHINWFPGYLKDGRFAKNIEQAPDWNISRDRFWATAMPVWKGDKGSIKVIGSYKELKELSGVELEDYHRPWVDDITFEIDDETFTRVDKVLDGWFESASMPFAQLHYPFENKEKFEKNYPADFIVEYVGQVRAWFYYVHALNIALAEAGAFGDIAEKYAYKNVITTGVIGGNDGRKMSKSLGNFTDPNELMDKFSADSLRFLLLSSPLVHGEDFSLQDKDVGDVARKLTMLWNMYDFFTMYAEVDGWQWEGVLADPSADLDNPLDIWIVSRLHETIQELETNMDAYNIGDALKPVLPFIDDASNWYVRRSRRRFWKSGDDQDKNNAYKTLHYILTQSAVMLAPFTPFLAEELYHNMTGSTESVHLLDWPNAGAIDGDILQEMNELREQITQALSLRAKAGIKIRQPLSSVTVPIVSDTVDSESILKEELNVKTVKIGETVAIDTDITPELKREGQSREIVRIVQNARKKAGLNVDDRIVLALTSSAGLGQTIDEYKAIIAQETLATKLLREKTSFAYQEQAEIDGQALELSLEKA